MNELAEHWTYEFCNQSSSNNFILVHIQVSKLPCVVGFFVFALLKHNLPAAANDTNHTETAH